MSTPLRLSLGFLFITGCRAAAVPPPACMPPFESARAEQVLRAWPPAESFRSFGLAVELPGCAEADGRVPGVVLLRQSLATSPTGSPRDLAIRVNLSLDPKTASPSPADAATFTDVETFLKTAAEEMKRDPTRAWLGAHLGGVVSVERAGAVPRAPTPHLGWCATVVPGSRGAGVLLWCGPDSVTISP